MSVDYTHMDYIQVQAFVGVLCGAVIMTSIHNLCVSIVMYKARQTNTSNILKIIFNFGQIVRTGGIFGLYMTPKLATKAQCYALLQFTMVGNVMVRLTLSAFLLWRLRQIRNVHNFGMDKWISIVLFTARAALTIPYFVFQRAGTLYMPAGDAVICLSVTPTPLPYGVTGVVLEFLIDSFVTFRLVQILIGANKNAAQVTTTNIRNKRSLFTAVMYWNFLRLFVSFLYHVTTVMDITETTPEIPSHAIKHPIAILLSYVITADAEIVRVIEGKNTKKGSSAGTDKSLKSVHSPNSYDSNDLPKYSQHAQTSTTHSELEDGKIALVSMKRLSFFEWANVVVGKRFRKNSDNGEEEHEDNEYDDEDIEEIIDGPSKSSSSDHDIEKDLSQDRRISNLSGTTSVTETSTLGENPDVVIH